MMCVLTKTEESVMPKIVDHETSHSTDGFSKNDKLTENHLNYFQRQEAMSIAGKELTALIQEIFEVSTPDAPMSDPRQLKRISKQVGRTAGAIKAFTEIVDHSSMGDIDVMEIVGKSQEEVYKAIVSRLSGFQNGPRGSVNGKG